MRRGRAWCSGLLACACAALSLAAPAGAQSSIAFAACHSRQVVVAARGLQCGTLDVPFDRARPALGSVALAVQRVPAIARRAGVIDLLAGGPGQPALPAFEELLAPLARDAALRGFELVAFDQRGTGQSQGLQCPPESFETLFKHGASSFLGACGAALGPTRAYYTSQESVEDLDALRRALGGTPLSLFAVSYGTRVAAMDAREHPQGVARMVLDSTVPTTGPDPLELVRVHALRRVLDEGVCGAGACRSFSRDVYADLVRVLGRLHRHPLGTRLYDGNGRLRPARVSEADLLRLLLGLDLSQGPRELAPAAIAAAARGNAAPLARLVGGSLPEAGGRILPYAPFANEAPASDSAISIALFAATFCVESELPWSPDSPPTGRAAILRRWLASLPAGATAPFLRAPVLAASPLSLCKGWPATAPAPTSPAGISQTPTLILSGVDDLRTPYEQDLAIATTYANAQLLRIPDAGHSTVTADQTGCAKRAMIEFLASGQAPPSCPGSREPQALPLPPSALAEVSPAASGNALAGRVATAAAMTLEDLFGQTSFSGAGLRGGSWEQQLEGYVLHGMLDVPGVALSGTVHVAPRTLDPLAITAHLTIRGRLPGRLTLHGLALSGEVGGTRVHARLAAL